MKDILLEVAVFIAAMVVFFAVAGVFLHFALPPAPEEDEEVKCLIIIVDKTPTFSAKDTEYVEDKYRQAAHLHP